MGKLNGEKKKDYRLAVLAGVNLLILTGVLCWMGWRSGKGTAIAFGQEDLILNRMQDENGSSVYHAEEGSYVDGSYEGRGREIVSPAFNLGSGLYEVTVTYESLYGTGTASIGNTSDEGWHNLYSDEVPLNEPGGGYCGISYLFQ